jgi:hypothetical protein
MYSYQRPSRNDDEEKRIGAMPGLRRGPKTEGDDQPADKRQQHRWSRPQPRANEKLADDDAINAERIAPAIME